MRQHKQVVYKAIVKYLMLALCILCEALCLIGLVDHVISEIGSGADGNLVAGAG
jgi:hypothetical protein